MKAFIIFVITRHIFYPGHRHIADIISGASVKWRKLREKLKFVTDLKRENVFPFMFHVIKH